MGNGNRLSQGGNSKLVRNWYPKCHKEPISLSAMCVCFALGTPNTAALNWSLICLSIYIGKNKAEQGKHLPNTACHYSLCCTQWHTANSSQPPLRWDKRIRQRAPAQDFSVEHSCLLHIQWHIPCSAASVVCQRHAPLLGSPANSLLLRRPPWRWLTSTAHLQYVGQSHWPVGAAAVSFLFCQAQNVWKNGWVENTCKQRIFVRKKSSKSSVISERLGSWRVCTCWGSHCKCRCDVFVCSPA